MTGQRITEGISGWKLCICVVFCLFVGQLFQQVVDPFKTTQQAQVQVAKLQISPASSGALTLKNFHSPEYIVWDRETYLTVSDFVYDRLILRTSSPAFPARISKAQLKELLESLKSEAHKITDF
jgi:hypothetical protein